MGEGCGRVAALVPFYVPFAWSAAIIQEPWK